MVSNAFAKDLPRTYNDGMDETLGMVLRRLRHARGQTLEEIAEATGISVAMLSRAERDQRMPSPETIETLARYYGVPVEQLEGHAIYQRSRQTGRPQSRAWAARMMQGESGPRSSAPPDEVPRIGSADADDAHILASALWAPDQAEPHASGAVPRIESRADSAPERGQCVAPRSGRSARHMSFAARPIEELFSAPDSRESLADATRVAEVALAAAMRAVERSTSSGDADEVAEAEAALERLRRMLSLGP